MGPTYLSFAKLNLHLQVLGRRPDGYHELATVFQTIDLADRVTVEATAGGGIELEVVGADLPAGPENLAWRAAALFHERFGRPGTGTRIRLGKRIPIGGGLGGGSSNAATVLLALARRARVAPDEPDLLAAARDLGADVPFFLVGGTAVGTGRGDRIAPLADALLPASTELVLAVPRTELATARVFAALGEPAPRALPAALANAIADPAAGPSLPDLVGWNDLEEPARRLSPALDAVYNSLVLSPARFVRLSGSGATVFAAFDDPAAARAAGLALPSGTAWWSVRPLGRAAWRRESGLFD
ncbi:MAG: 4-(cytidine 5'-diphospho)-2-C-methyl-D-erythritol kinase [Thermoanaerobaculia bacterium]